MGPVQERQFQGRGLRQLSTSFFLRRSGPPDSPPVRTDLGSGCHSRARRSRFTGPCRGSAQASRAIGGEAQSALRRPNAIRASCSYIALQPSGKFCLPERPQCHPQRATRFDVFLGQGAILGPVLAQVEQARVGPLAAPPGCGKAPRHRLPRPQRRSFTSFSGSSTGTCPARGQARGNPSVLAQLNADFLEPC